MALFVLLKLIRQTPMCSHPGGLDVWFHVYFHTSWVRTVKLGETSLVVFVISTIISWADSFLLLHVLGTVATPFFFCPKRHFCIVIILIFGSYRFMPFQTPFKRRLNSVFPSSQSWGINKNTVYHFKRSSLLFILLTNHQLFQENHFREKQQISREISGKNTGISLRKHGALHVKS